MLTPATSLRTSPGRTHASFAAFILVSGLAFYFTLAGLGQYSLHNSSSPHIVLIPFVSFFLLYLERATIFANASPNRGLGIDLAAAGLMLFVVASRGPIPQE